jgi:hypothetical protein
VEVLGRLATACEKQSVDEVALDVSVEAKRRLEERPLADIVDEVQGYSCLEGLPPDALVDITQVRRYQDVTSCLTQAC